LELTAPLGARAGNGVKIAAASCSPFGEHRRRSSSAVLGVMKKPLVLAIASTLVALYAPAIFAEVSDKIPSFARLWVQGAGAAIFGFLAARFTRWWWLIPIALAALFLFGAWDMFADKHLAEAIRHEQGTNYELVAWLSAVLPIAATLLGYLARRRHTRRGRAIHDA
jgi:hypothetical protein